jgi:hypothetical protein
MASLFAGYQMRRPAATDRKMRIFPPNKGFSIEMAHLADKSGQ